MLTGRARPLIFAHRGASAYAPENTLAAFKLALQQGADGIELDAKLSADGQVVVIHDPTVNRTTNGKGRVNQLTLIQLRELDAGYKFSLAFKDEKIPTLADVFEAVGGKLIINVELTNYESPADGLPGKVVQLVQEYQLEDSVIFSSFLPSNLIEVRNIWPLARVAILARPGLAGRQARSDDSRAIAPNFLNPYFIDVSKTLISRELANGRLVNVWTVNIPFVMKKMIRDGVHGLITDNPVAALEIRGRQ